MQIFVTRTISADWSIEESTILAALYFWSILSIKNYSIYKMGNNKKMKHIIFNAIF